MGLDVQFAKNNVLTGIRALVWNYWELADYALKHWLLKSLLYIEPGRQAQNKESLSMSRSVDQRQNWWCLQLLNKRELKTYLSLLLMPGVTKWLKKLYCLGTYLFRNDKRKLGRKLKPLTLHHIHCFLLSHFLAMLWISAAFSFSLSKGLAIS